MVVVMVMVVVAVMAVLVVVVVMVVVVACGGHKPGPTRTARGITVVHSNIGWPPPTTGQLRPGWLHSYRMASYTGWTQWLTLPIGQPFGTD